MSACIEGNAKIAGTLTNFCLPIGQYTDIRYITFKVSKKI